MKLDLTALEAELLVTEHVKVAEGRGFDVVGLPLDGIVAIAQRHWTDVSGLFDKLVAQAAEGTFSLDQANWVGGALLGALPRVAAEVIACSAGYGSPDAADIFQKLPFTTQLDALEKIAALTFTSEMPPKKVIETVVRTIAGSGKVLLGTPST